MAQTTVSIRMDDQLKKQMEWLCGEFGMSFSTAVTVFAKATVRESRIPFEISAIPNATTLAAFEEAEAILHDKSVRRYSDVEDALKELKA
ncbi:MAG: type II toxin-antitoxin system RelB/DinJ family antitoxin [Clostridiales bacterium]|nr:type II toxin-antitoxin system RelB/DinJ family antitoxin [Clostridiales bacterium]